MKNVKEILLIILSVFLIVLSMIVFIAKEKKSIERQKAEIELNKLRSVSEGLQKGYSSQENINLEYSQKIQDLERETSSLEVQLTQIRKAYSDADNQLKQAENAISRAKGQMQQMMFEKRRLKESISTAEASIGTLEDKIALLRETTLALKRHYNKLKHQDFNSDSRQLSQQTKPDQVVEVKKITQEAQGALSQSQTYQKPQPEQPNSDYDTFKSKVVEAEVLVVNREFNFIVISAGKEDGVKEGDALAVYDGDKLLGKVYIETVRDNISAASGGKDLDAYKIKAGYKVKL